jgi:hypothetical protein
MRLLDLRHAERRAAPHQGGYSRRYFLGAADEAYLDRSKQPWVVLPEGEIFEAQPAA